MAAAAGCVKRALQKPAKNFSLSGMGNDRQNYPSTRRVPVNTLSARGIGKHFGLSCDHPVPS